MLLHKDSQDGLIKLRWLSLKLMAYIGFKATLGKNKRRERKRRENYSPVASQEEQWWGSQRQTSCLMQDMTPKHISHSNCVILMRTDSSSRLVVRTYNTRLWHAWWGAHFAPWKLSFMHANYWGNVCWICKRLLPAVLFSRYYSNKLKTRGEGWRDCTENGEGEEIQKARKKQHLGYKGETATAAQGRWVTRHRPAGERQATKQALEGTQVKLSTRNYVWSPYRNNYVTHIATSRRLCLLVKCISGMVDTL